MSADMKRILFGEGDKFMLATKLIDQRETMFIWYLLSVMTEGEKTTTPRTYLDSSMVRSAPLSANLE